MVMNGKTCHTWGTLFVSPPALYGGEPICGNGPALARRALSPYAGNLFAHAVRSAVFVIRAKEPKPYKRREDREAEDPAKPLGASLVPS